MPSFALGPRASNRLFVVSGSTPSVVMESIGRVNFILTMVLVIVIRIRLEGYELWLFVGSTFGIVVGPSIRAVGKRLGCMVELVLLGRVSREC